LLDCRSIFRTGVTAKDENMIYLAAIFIGYFLGAIPIGYITVWLTRRKNLLEEGSGRIGSTNALRAGGWAAGVITFIGDLSKSALAILIVRALWDNNMAEAVAGAAAILGHNASLIVWVLARRFGGGAGATSYTGGAVVLWWPMVVVLMPLIFITLFVIGYSSVTSTLLVIATCLIFALRVASGLAPSSDLVYAVIAGILVAYALRPNYIRLWHGTEQTMPMYCKRLLPKLKDIFRRRFSKRAQHG
jgi:acyl phosphate:glycerol-3-phosphate acyltransferase